MLALLVCVLSEAALFAAVAIQAKRLNAPALADVLIVLGARVEPDGTPSPALGRRLDRALACYEAGYAPVIITTGGQGDDEPMPEGEAMRAYLIAQGVPMAAVLAETNSYNTAENIEGAKAIMEEIGAETAVIVTSDYHLWRALDMAARAGIEATGAGSQNALTRPVAFRNIVQETLSWIKYVIIR